VAFVYDAAGRLVAEYQTNTPTGPVQTSYITMDHLGSTRLVMTTNASNQVVVRARYDYLPFGEEMPSGIGGRTIGIGYGGTDTTKQKFTGHERDQESKLDFAQARYCSSLTGRFMSVDRIGTTFSRMIDPQQFNRYGYGRNNPLKYFDPDGNDIKLKSGMKKDDADKILKSLVRMYRKESGRTAIERMEKSDMTFVIGTGKLSSP
jgi:RHS repeat-associated protein